MAKKPSKVELKPC